jgi:tetratricopeptide (TPR) repeat protein
MVDRESPVTEVVDMAMSGEADMADGFPARLRARRRAAGLSQTELAGSAMSASYVSLLESGRRSPTPAAVEALAARLGCSSDLLLHGADPADADRARLALDYAELALRNGEAAAALAQVETLAADVTGEERWRSRRLRARALEALGRLEEAIGEIESLREAARAERRHGEHLRLTVDAVRCYQEAGDVAYAIDVGEEALATVRTVGLAGTDVHAELVSSVAGAYYERGDLVRAQRLASGVLEELDEAGSAHARASVYWNASLVAEQRDDLPVALQLAERALAVYAEGDDERALARLRVAHGWLLLRSVPPRPADARRALSASLAVLADVGSSVDLAYCETELARCDVLLGDPASALGLAESALSRLGAGPRLERAHTMLVRARSLLALDRGDEAVTAYREAASMLAGLELSRQAAAAWRELADAFAQLGLLADAALAYQQALTDAGVRAAPDVSYRGATTEVGPASTPTTGSVP